MNKIQYILNHPHRRVFPNTNTTLTKKSTLISRELKLHWSKPWVWTRVMRCEIIRGMARCMWDVIPKICEMCQISMTRELLVSSVWYVDFLTLIRKSHHYRLPTYEQKFPSDQFGTISVDMGYFLGSNWNLCITWLISRPSQGKVQHVWPGGRRFLGGASFFSPMHRGGLVFSHICTGA